MAAALTPEVVDGILALVPDDWLRGRRVRLHGGDAGARTAATCSIASPRRAVSRRRRRVPADYSYDYAIIRVVPRVDRGEQINAGVILSCADTDFLDARIELDEARLRRSIPRWTSRPFAPSSP